MVADGYKDTEIGAIPVKWEIDKLENLVNIISGQSPSRFDLTGSQYKFFKVNQLNFCEKYLTNSEYAFDKEIDNLLDSGTVIFPKRGASIFTNKVRILTHKSFIDTNLMGLITTDSLNNMFLYYWLVEFELSNIADTSSVPQINNKHINPLKIPLPPLKEQEKIADILSTADEKIAAIEVQIQKAETLKKGLLQKLLSEGIGHSEFKDSELGKIPKSWEVVKLDKLLENKSITSHLDGNHGGLYPKQSEFVESGTPYLSANMIKGNNIDFSLAKFLTKERASKFRKGVAKDKDVLFAHNATVGPVTLLETNLDYVILSTTLTYYRCDLEKLNNYYLMNYMKSIYFINQYEKFMKQSTRNQIPITQQRQLYFIIPPLEEQKQIADILSTADEKLEVLRAKKEKYKILKKGLLQKLLSGEVRVNDK